MDDENVVVEIIKEGVSAEEVYKQLKKDGVKVAIKNGIHCKIVDGTYEAINAIPPEVIVHKEV